MTKQQIEQFLISKRGYLKKSPLETAIAIWKTSSTHIKPKTQAQLDKELALIKQVQQTLRKAEVIVESNKSNELAELYNAIIHEKTRPKRILYFDIETSPNLVFSWSVGRKINIDYDNIVQERAIICICYKWEGEKEVHSLQWDKGNDEKMIKKFAEIINSADIIVGQNSDQFDIKWLRTRCLYHGIHLKSKFQSVDTLKLAKAGFRFNSNRLDYMGKFLGLGGKNFTTFNLWKMITLENSKEAMDTMIDYCKKDVILLEEVYNKLKPFVPEKKFKVMF